MAPANCLAVNSAISVISRRITFHGSPYAPTLPVVVSCLVSVTPVESKDDARNPLNEHDSMILPAGPPAAHPEAEAGYRERLRTSILIGLCCLVVYNANLRAISAGDAYPARYLPFAIVQYHTIFLDPVAKVAAQGRADGAFW